jgi:hypothetical protein
VSVRLRRVLTTATVAALMLVSLGAAPARANGDPNDPYDSGCVNTAYIANSADIHTIAGTTFGHVENWYSWGCKTNWALLFVYVEPSRDYIEIHTKGQSPYNPPPPGAHRQCEPTNCSSFYTGGQSPLWTDMVEGQDVACLDADVEAFDPKLGYDTAADTFAEYGGVDTICA